jgi:hypothetical protein
MKGSSSTVQLKSDTRNHVMDYVLEVLTNEFYAYFSGDRESVF